MTQTCKTVMVKTKPTEDNPDGYIVINDSDFNAEVHKLYGVEEKPKAPTRSDLDSALAALPGNQTDPEYVVGAMRSFYGDLFTDDDEAKVRELVKVPEKKPSFGLNVAELKDALAVRGITIPDGVTLKAELAALLDNAPA